MTKEYRIFNGDNFHAYDDDDGAEAWEFYKTQEEAVAAARLIVDTSLRWERMLIKNPADPQELYDRYIDFGDYPVIRPETETRFSVWEYAKVRCVDICLEPFDRK